jgi:hypothetical protein
MTAKPPKSRDNQRTAEARERQRRSAEALRANLRRRKAQARDRIEPPDGPEGPDRAAPAPDASEGT